MACCCCGLKILNKWQMVNDSVTDTLFRSLGKQMKVKYVCDWHFFCFSNLLAWPMSECAFAICDKAVNWRTPKSKEPVVW